MGTRVPERTSPAAGAIRPEQLRGEGIVVVAVQRTDRVPGGSRVAHDVAHDELTVNIGTAPDQRVRRRGETDDAVSTVDDRHEDTSLDGKRAPLRLRPERQTLELLHRFLLRGGTERLEAETGA